MLYPYGNNLKVYIEGTSHGEQMELFMDGFPKGVTVDSKGLSAFMKRRAPGQNEYSTKRHEADEPQFLDGVTNGVTNGERIHAVIKNTDTKSSDYSDVNDVPRPSHADYAAVMKYGSSVDHRGGGHFSGRLTAMLCVAGFLCMQYLNSKGINVFAHIYSIADVKDTEFGLVNVGRQQPQIGDFPVLDPGAGERMKAAITAAGSTGDSLGGVVECAVTGVPAGFGEHMFAGVEGRVSSLLFSIPAVKGVEFGLGFGSSFLHGSENNDCFVTDGKTIGTLTNNCGGILGGMTNGMPIVFRAAFKPTPSISITQQSVSLSHMKNVELRIKGRHDPCIVPRAVPVVEAAAAVAICDILLDGNRGN